MGTQLPSPKEAQPPIFGLYLLRPNGCMDQDATLYGGRPPPRRLCVRWDPTSPSKRVRSPPPKFSAHVYCVQTAGWTNMALGMHAGRPQPRRLCVRWGPSLPSPKGAKQFSAHVYCGQTAGWINMVLGMEVGLGPDHVVLDRDPAPLPSCPPQRGGRAPSFRPIFIVAKLLDASRCRLVWR